MHKKSANPSLHPIAAPRERLRLSFSFDDFAKSFIIGALQKMSCLELTESERQKPYANYYFKESATIPDIVLENIHNKAYTYQQALPFENINDLLLPGYLPME
ncbi:MAG TPA: hypothetical protein PLP18_11470, partial [Smithellaceae bacterium]|nr:hypothetical protein [Smithellaceae bacterium]